MSTADLCRRAFSAKLPNTILKRECAGGLLQFLNVACSSSMSRVVSVCKVSVWCKNVSTHTSDGCRFLQMASFGRTDFTPIILRHKFVLQSETRSCIGVGNNRVSGRCVGWGPGIVIGHEGRANVWINQRNAVVKAAGNHVRLARESWITSWCVSQSTQRYPNCSMFVPGVRRVTRNNLDETMKERDVSTHFFHVWL